MYQCNDLKGLPYKEDKGEKVLELLFYFENTFMCFDKKHTSRSFFCTEDVFKVQC